MNRREKTLALVVAAMVGLLLLGVMVNRMYVQPKRQLQVQLAGARDTYQQNQDTLETGRFAAQLVAEKVDRTFATDPADALAISRSRLVEMLEHADLPVQLTRIDAERVDRQADNLTVGWSVSTRGRLAQLHRFLYMLQADPYLSRIESMSLRAQPRSVEYTLTLRYLALVLRDAGREAPVQLAPVPQPEGELYRQSWTLVSRNVFRPFLPRPAPPPPEPRQAEQPRSQPQQRQPEPEQPRPTHVLSSLTETPKGYDIVVRSVIDGRSSFSDYSIGDRLGGGRIVMVEVRWREDPHEQQRYSPSRVILDIDGDYWAIEIDQPLNRRYRIASDRLPEALQTRQTGTDSPEASTDGT